MTPQNLHILKTPEEIGAAAGEILCNLVRNKAEAVLGFATGATPLPLYAYMAQQRRESKVSFAGIRTFNLDEYCGLPREHPNSYFSFMMENLFSQIDVQPENIQFLNGNAMDIPAECTRYEQAIEAAGGIDLQILGIGRNGHIGFNEPSDVFSDGAFQISLTEDTIDANKGYFSDREIPLIALTMGIGDILRAKEIVMIATGAAKAQAVKGMLEGPVTPQCPASILQTYTGTITLFLDEAAAGLLESR